MKTQQFHIDEALDRRAYMRMASQEPYLLASIEHDVNDGRLATEIKLRAFADGATPELARWIFMVARYLSSNNS